MNPCHSFAYGADLIIAGNTGKGSVVDALSGPDPFLSRLCVQGVRTAPDAAVGAVLQSRCPHANELMPQEGARGGWELLGCPVFLAASDSASDLGKMA